MPENKYIYSKITRGESPSYDKFVTKDELNEVKEELLSEIETTDTILDNHLDDLNNPHEVTKTQIGLEYVVNKPMDSEVTENSENYISSGAVKTYVDENSGKIDSISINNINQPIINKNVNLNVFPIDINEQFIRITDLESGIYRLKFNGTIYIYYNGYSSTDSYIIGDTQTLQIIQPVLTVIKGYNHDKDCDYWYWYLQANEFVKGFIDGDTNNGIYEVDNVFTTTLKNKLDGIEAGAQVNAANTVVDANYVHTDNNFTTEEKNKLADIESQANKTIVDDTLNSLSTNPVQNKVITEALNNKVDKISGKGLSTNDFTTEYKNAVDANTAKVSNVQANWDVSSGLAQILNKPSIYNQSEIDDFLVLEISLADIDPSHTVGGRPVIIPETATKIKSFKYRLKFQKVLIDESASEDDYMILSPSDITNEYDDSIDPTTGEPYGTWTAAYYSYISGTGAVFTPGNFITVLFIETPDDLCICGFTNNMIPATIMSSNGNLSLGDGDGGAIGSDIAFQEPLISGSNIKTINNQNILTSGNIDIPEISFIADINTTTGATNINGKNLSAYNVISYTSGDYTGYEIKQNNESLNETQAAQFLKGLTGNPILPVYNYDYPNNSYLIRATDGQILKPQYDSNSLKLYNMQKIVTNKTGMPYLTTAPTSDNLSGGLQFVVLSSEPQTKYNGYIYFITSNSN